MNYDIEVFSTDKPTLTGTPEGRGWQITADDPLNVEPYDIPAQARSALPGLRFVTRFHLEGNAPAAARKKLIAAARALATQARGVVVDQQEGTVETPRGVRRLMTHPESAVRGVVQLSWFVEDVEPLVQSAAAELVDAFERTLPECLPRRYGLTEPAQFKLETEGLPNFRQFLAQHVRDFVVWDCHKPCQHVLLSVPDRVGTTPRGFRCGRLTLNVDGSAASDQAWRVELTRLWLTVADLIRPFYAEIRSGECPTKSWWWNGIPTAAPAAMLIGDPYPGLWSDFVRGARVTTKGLLYKELFADAGGSDSGARLPSPPVGIARPPDRPLAQLDLSKGDLLSALRQDVTSYPDVWPFEGPIS